MRLQAGNPVNSVRNDEVYVYGCGSSQTHTVDMTIPMKPAPRKLSKGGTDGIAVALESKSKPRKGRMTAS